MAEGVHVQRARRNNPHSSARESAKKKILIVGDKKLQKEYAEYLVQGKYTEENGYNIVFANNLEEADNTLKNPKDRPVLVITGLNMAGDNSDGIKLIQNVRRKHVPSPNIPIIVVSEAATDVTQTHARYKFDVLADPFGQQNITRQNDDRQATEKSKTILVVDDNLTQRNFYKESLSLEGYNVISATNGKKALEALKNLKPDLIITDRRMPEMDGLRLIEAIRNGNGESANVPILMASASIDNEVRTLAQGTELNFGCLDKPFTLNSLLELVEQKLSQGEQQQKPYPGALLALVANKLSQVAQQQNYIGAA